MAKPPSQVNEASIGQGSDDQFPRIEDVVPESADTFHASWRLKVAFGAIMLITLMAAIDATALSVALADIGGSSVEIFWVGTSFLLASTVFQPNTGSFSNIFGRRPVLFLSLALFGIGSIIAAVASDVATLLVGRSIQGVGGGGIITMSEVIITDLIPLRERGKWYSLQSSMWSLGTVLGPLVGGGLAKASMWRGIFWLNIPLLAIGCPLIFCFLRLHMPVTSLRAKLRRVDWVGSVLFVASATGLLIPITWGGVQFPWDSWHTLVPLIVCAIGLIVLIIYEWLWVPMGTEPLIRLDLFAARSASSVFAQNVLHGMILWCIIYYLPLYYEGVKEYSSLLAAVALFPLSFTVAPAAAIVGILVAKSGRVRWALWVGWLLSTLGTGLLIYLQANTSVVAFIFLTLVSGVGLGMLFTAMAIGLQAASKPELQAHSMTMFTLLRNLGQTVGVAVGSTVFLNTVKSRLESYAELSERAGQLSSDAIALVHVIQNLPEGSEKDHLKTAFVGGLLYVWVLTCATSFVALLCSLLVGPLSLDQEMKTDQGFKLDDRAVLNSSHGGESGSSEHNLQHTNNNDEATLDQQT